MIKGSVMSHFKVRHSAVPLLLSLSALALPQIANATHFRGGSVTWQAVALDGDGIKNDVRITVKTAWRSDSINSATLTSTPSLSIANKGEEPRICVGPGTTVTAPTTCSGVAGTEYALTTTYFEAKNLDPNIAYTVAFTGGARISTLQNNADGQWNIQTKIYLKDGNLAPKVDLPIILEVPMLKTGGAKLDNWTFDISSSDPNADKLRYRLANASELGCPASGPCVYTNPAGLSINPNTGLLTWTNSGNLTAGHQYSAGIVAEDVDAVGASKSKTHVDFILTLLNKAAVDLDPTTDIVPSGGGTFPETRNVRVNKGDSYTFDVTASNIDTTSLGNLRGALVESPANRFTFTPGAPGTGLDPGSYPITFQLSDNTNARSDSYLVINFIVPDPLAPQILNIEGDRTVYSNNSTTPGDAAQQLVDQSLDAIVQDVDSTDLNGGFALFNVTFTDGAYERLGIQSAGDGAGQIRFDGTQVYYEGQSIGTMDPTQDGVGRALRINFTSTNATLAAAQALVRSLTYQDTFTLRPAGDRGLSLFIQDGQGHSNSYDFFVNVQQHATAPPANTGPLEAANRISVTEGTTAALSDANISYADPDGDTITFTVSSITHGQFELVSAPGVAITTFTQQDVTLGKIAFAHDGSEVAPTYSLTASDGTGHTTTPSPGEITYFGVNDHTPLISGTPAVTVLEGAAYSFTPTASDGDVGIGGQLVFSIANKPTWASFNTTTGRLSGTPAHGDIGSYSNIVISVSDDNGVTKVNLPAFTITVLPIPDADGDGLPGGSDPDDTNPCIPSRNNAACVAYDTDGDGLPNASDPNDGNPDTDGDGIPDGADVDVNGDGIPDNGTDSDGDGINDASDVDQVGGGDADGDGIADSKDTIDNRTDADHDGMPDAVDPNDSNPDTDGDGIPDGADVDVNGDGIPDNGTDRDGDGINDLADADSYPPGRDRDHDGVIDEYDLDIDGDGIPNTQEGSGDLDGDGIPDDRDIDTDGDGIPDILEGTGDADGDGTPNYRDTDSDNDGVPDALELAGLHIDTDGDGIPDRFDVDQTGGVDANGDGIDDAGLPDSDHDGLSDLVDPDQDNDGIPDLFESGAYGFDSDGDGIDDRWDADTPGNKDENHDGIADDARPLDSDMDGIPDMLDLDSDNDGVSDATESGAKGTDSDGDGIDDAFDVDVVGGPDANHDGVADSAKPRDSDGDGVPDYLDLDSDNDGIPDVIESGGLDLDEDGLLDAGSTITSMPRDSDGDGIPDMLDLDSDNDGVFDIVGTMSRRFDKNGDGRIDSIIDSDGDGIPDVIDVEPGQRGFRSDADGDGVPSIRDLDDDGDGIPDSVEGEGDTDGDGVIDRLDHDADNDGIPDRIEMGLPARSGIDANGNGIDDAYEHAVLRDTDRDGIPDYLDSDSDNDGVPDAREILRVALSGADADGDGIDDAIDVDATGGVDANGDGVDDAMVNLADTDGDHVPDYRDADSDNDGIPDGKEWGDFNKDGINDALQKDPGLKTGIKGGGGGSFGWLLVLPLLALACVRKLPKGMRANGARAAMLMLALGVSGLQATTARADESSSACASGSGFGEGCWSIGVGAFATKLQPDDSQSVWKVTDDSDVGYKLSAAYRFHQHWFVEFGYADMGSATVTSLNPSIGGREQIDYSIPSVFAGYQLFDETSRFNVHAKVGYASLSTDAASYVIEKQQHSNQIALGAGARLRLWRRLEAQLEHEYYDKDARQTGLSLWYAF
jgi:large repetitive protein